MTIESLAFSSSASGLPAGGFTPATTCTLTFHVRVDGVDAARSVVGWSNSAGQPVHAADSEAAQAGASTLRRRSLTLTF